MNSRQLLRFAGLILDAMYLASWVFVIWYPWVAFLSIASLALGGWSLSVALRVDSEQAWKPWKILAVPFLPYTMSFLSLQNESFSKAFLLHDERQIGDLRTRSLRLRVALACVCAMGIAVSSTNFIGERMVEPAFEPIDEHTERYVNRSLALAAASYASARGVDRVISMVSEVQVGIGFASGRPFQFLKPLQDMAVRFSDFVVWTMVALGIMLAGFHLSQVVTIPVLVSAIFGVSVLYLIGPRTWSRSLGTMLKAGVVITIAFRFAIPLVAGMMFLISSAVLDERRAEAQEEIDAGTEAIEEASPEVQEDEDGWSFSDGKEMIEEYIGVVGNFGESMIDRFIQLFVVYAIEVFIVPLIVLFGLWKAAKAYVVPAANVGRQGILEMQMAARGLQGEQVGRESEARLSGPSSS